MPHFIIEYSANLEGKLDVAGLFERIHAQLIALGLFPTGGIRSRARRVEEYRFADGLRNYAGVHAVLKLSAARPPELRRQVGEVVFAALHEHCVPLQAERYLALSMVVELFEPELFFNENNLHALFEAPSG